MASDEGPVVQSARLRRDLVRLRVERGYTQEMVAREMLWSPLKLLRIENGHTAVSINDLKVMLRYYGVTSETEIERLMMLRREARQRGWWWKWQKDVTVAMRLNYIGYEAGASCIRQSPGPTVPELLQTPDYARAQIASLTDAQLSTFGRDFERPRLIDAMVELRMERQAALAQRSAPPRQDYVLDEGIIRRHVGLERDPMIMPEQLRHIVDVAENDELVTVLLIPFAAGAHAGLASQLTLLQFDGDLPDRLYFDSGIEMIVRDSADGEFMGYVEVFELLLKVTLSPKESVDFIRRAAKDMS